MQSALWNSDELLFGTQHFSFACQEGRALLTFNIHDFVPIASAAMRANQAFPGLIVSDQLEFKMLLRRILRLLGSRRAEDIAGNIVWLSDFR